MEVITAPDERLNTVCTEVDPSSPNIATLAEGMVETMIRHNGRGLAAPQVGYLSRLFCMKYGSGVLIMCNPRIVRRGKDVTAGEEGCLSIPGRKAMVDRHKIITVEWVDLGGGARSAKMRGLDARCVQHEIDHLDGILIPVGGV